MIRILHLISHDADFQTQRAIGQLVAGLGDGFSCRVRRIGPGGDLRGLPAAVVALRRGSEQDLIHAWSLPALAAAVLAGAPSVAFTPPAEMAAGAVRWLAAILACRPDVHIIVSSATRHRQLVTRGIDLNHCHLIRPGIEFSRLRRRPDVELRRRLRLEESDIALLAAGETTAAASHADAVWAAAILHTLDRRFKLLLWGQGRATERTLRFARRLHAMDMVRVARDELRQAVEFDQLLPASNLVLNTSVGATATLPLCMAMGAAMPIVSTVTHSVAELLEDRHTAILVPPRAPRQMAQRLLALHEDAALQWRLGDMARTEAYEYFSLTRFLGQHRAFYQQFLEGRPIEIPQQKPGAGLRFHGRA